MRATKGWKVLSLDLMDSGPCVSIFGAYLVWHAEGGPYRQRVS